MTRSLPKAREATEVRIDNETSDAFTIIDVFADDRQGLLYVITNAIFQLGLVDSCRADFDAAGSSRRRVLCDGSGGKEAGRDHAQLERVASGN